MWTLLISLIGLIWTPTIDAFYTSSVSAPGLISVGNLESEVFLQIESGVNQALIVENLIDGGFENGGLGFEGGNIIDHFDLDFEGLTIDTVLPLSGLKMARIEQNIFDTKSILRFYIPQRTANLRIVANLVSSTNKFVSESELLIKINGRDFARYGIEAVNPNNLADGVTRQSGFFPIELNLLDEEAPIEVEVVNSKYPETVFWDQTVLIDDITTDFVNTNSSSTFEITQVGAYMPHKYYDYGEGVIENAAFGLLDGSYQVSYFAGNDFGKLSATKSAQININTAALASIGDLQKTLGSSDSASLSFSYFRDKPLMAKILKNTACVDVATSLETQYRPLPSSGFFETFSGLNSYCYGVTLLDKYGNTSPLSNLVQ